MKKIITIGREYGSGGAIVGRILAEKMGIPLYDREIIDMAVKASGLSREIVENAEMKAKSAFSYSLSSALTFGDGLMSEPISLNDKMFLTLFDVITEIGQLNGAVILGSCADYILKENPYATHVYLYGPFEDRVKRAIEEYGIDQDGAKEVVKSHDKARMHYYNYHTSQKWGDCKNYHLCLDTSTANLEDVACIIEEFVNFRLKRMERLYE